MAAVAFLAAGCAGPRVAMRQGYDFSKIRRVAVLTFGGPGGASAADALAQELLGAGVDVVERQRIDAILQEQHYAKTGVLDETTVHKIGKIFGVDAIFTGTVAHATSTQSYLVTSADEGKLVVGGATPIGSSTVVGGLSGGAPGTSVVTSAASASVLAKMIEVETGSLLWSATDKDEGFDTLATFSTIAKSFVQSLQPVWLKRQ